MILLSDQIRKLTPFFFFEETKADLIDHVFLPLASFSEASENPAHKLVFATSSALWVRYMFVSLLLSSHSERSQFTWITLY